MRWLRLLPCALAFLSHSASARTWNIQPDGGGDAPTIQAGIDSAQAGDDVLLAPGIYSWTSQGGNSSSLLQMKRDVTLHSQTGAENTVVDAEYQGRVIDCVDVGSATIDGLTIQGGQPPPSDQVLGGGIRSTGDSQLGISNCIVRENNAFGGIQSRGGGISCNGGWISNCQVLDNHVQGQHGNGGGLACSHTQVTGCTIRGNRSRGGDGYSRGGGVVANSSDFTDCRIEANVNAGSFFGGAGGGMNLEGGSLLRCSITGNRLEGSRSTYGGGVFCANSVVTDCVFIGNFVRGYGFPTDFWGGAALASGDGSQPNTVTGCTLIGNVAESGSSLGISPIGGLATGGTVRRTLIVSNTGAACYGSAVFECVDAYDNSGGNALCGIDGGGNFSADPQFCSLDPIGTQSVVIQSDSPCAPGNHPNDASCGLIGAGLVGCGATSIEQHSWTTVKGLYR